jgi:AcrR family transcriptional regulator
VVVRRIREGTTGELLEHVDALVEWGLSYQRRGWTEEALPSWSLDPERTSDPFGEDSEPSGGTRRQAKLSQRRRIIHAAAVMAADRGYRNLSIPTITNEAGVSNETFYEYFESAEDAFLQSIEVFGRSELGPIGEAIASQPGWAAGVGAGLEEMLDYLDHNPKLARLPFIEALGAGPAALDQVESFLDALTELFGLSEATDPTGRTLPPIVVEAICGGVFVAIQAEIADGHVGFLSKRLPDIAFVVLAPYGVV